MRLLHIVTQRPALASVGVLDFERHPALGIFLQVNEHGAHRAMVRHIGRSGAERLRADGEAQENASEASSGRETAQGGEPWAQKRCLSGTPVA